MSDTPLSDALKDQYCMSHLVWYNLCGELERDNAALREDIQTLCGIIDHANPNAWENGNTHPDGHGPDEGTVIMEQLYGPLWHKYMQPVIAARKEAQP